MTRALNAKVGLEGAHDHMPYRVLVIEDDPTSLDLIVYLLTSFGHIALTASDGDEGLRAAAAEIPDVILCDIMLPTLDGFGVLKCIRENKALDHVPVIAVTALAMVGDRERVLAAGFDGYISKPLDPERFVTEVEKLGTPRASSNAAAPRPRG